MTGHWQNTLAVGDLSQTVCSCGWTSSIADPLTVHIQYDAHFVAASKAYRELLDSLGISPPPGDTLWPPPCCTHCGCYVALPEVHAGQCVGRAAAELADRGRVRLEWGAAGGDP